MSEKKDELRYRDLTPIRAAVAMNTALVGFILFGPIGAAIGGALGSYGGRK